MKEFLKKRFFVRIFRFVKASQRSWPRARRRRGTTGPPLRRGFEKHQNSRLDKRSRFEQGIDQDPHFKARIFCSISEMHYCIVESLIVSRVVFED